MDVRLTIGQFSKMTYLSVKALRHYHDVGLMAPADVDPETGYRYYAASQVGTAQAIRRFRDVDMPIEDVRHILEATDDAERQQVIVEHLERLHRQLERTQVSVASLQALLVDPRPDHADVELRHIPSTLVVVTRRTVGFDDCAGWLEDAFGGLHASIADRRSVVDGPDGALYPDEFFENDAGEVTAYVPVVAGPTSLPATNVAVLRHTGPFTELDQTYGALGTIVAERGIGAPGPIREHYLTPTTTEVCWPVAIGAA